MISPVKVSFNGKSNQSFPTFNLLCDLAFDSDNGEVSTGLNREIVSTESYNGKIKYATGVKYNEVLAPKVTLIKEDYSDLTLSEQRQILSWLTSRSTPGFMDVYYGDDDTAIVYSIFGAPIDIQTYKLANNRTVGITFTFESVSPFAFSGVRKETYTIPYKNNAQIKITSHTDDDAFVYPKITIVPNKSDNVIEIDSIDFFNDHYIDGTVYKYDNQFYWKKNNVSFAAQDEDTSGIETTGIYIENQTTKTDATYIGGIGTDETITIDGANKIITSSNADRVLGSGFSWNWLGLQRGENILKIFGNCTITLEWRDVMKVGTW